MDAKNATESVRVNRSYVVTPDAQLNYALEHCLSIKPGPAPAIHSQRNSELIGNTKVATQQAGNFLPLSAMQIISSMGERAARCLLRSVLMPEISCSVEPLTSPPLVPQGSGRNMLT